MSGEEWRAAMRAAARARPAAAPAKDAAPPVEVRVSPTGDSAEAGSPESARLAARTLLGEAFDMHGCGDPRASFVVAGRLVRGGLKLREV